MDTSSSGPFSLSPEKWLSILKLAEKTQNAVDAEDRHFIVKDGYRYYTLSELEIKGDIKKLSINEIKTISHAQLRNLEQSYLSGNTEMKDIKNLMKDIQDYTKKLSVQEKENKPNKKLKRKIQNITHFFSGLRSSQSNQEVGKAAPHLKTIEKQKQLNLDLPVEKGEATDKIHQQIQRIPQLLEELKSEVSDQDRLELIQDRMIKDFPKQGAKEEYVSQFANDMQRGVAFLRKDSYLQIEDQNPQPSYQLEGETRVKAGVQAFQDLFKTEQDKRWETALQLVANQTSLNNIFDAAIVKFNLDAISNEVSWPDLEASDDKNFQLVAKFSENLPPVKLEIIRNSDTHAIEKVKVEVNGSIDILRQWQEKRGGEKVILPNAIHGTLTYTVTLDNQNHPIISDLHSSLKSAS